MKIFMKYAWLLLALLPVSCQDDELGGSEVVSEFQITGNEVKVQISKNGIVSPKWISDAVEAISDKHGGRPMTYVSQLVYKGEVYVLINDGYDNCYTCGNRLYTPLGEEIEETSPVYQEMIFIGSSSEEVQKQLIWSN